MFLKNEKEIIEWLSNFKIKKYVINKDYTVDIYDRLDLSYMELTSIPIEFNFIEGYFDCSDNNLTSLKGCPKVIKGDFFCYNNQLSNLQFSPEIVKGNIINFSKNPIEEESLLFFSTDLTLVERIVSFDNVVYDKEDFLIYTNKLKIKNEFEILNNNINHNKMKMKKL